MDEGRLRALGASGVKVSPLGVGTNRWRKGVNDGAVFEAYQALQDGGVSFLDTAEIYGFGQSERLVGETIRRDGRPATVASKFAPVVGRASPKGLLAALDASLARLVRLDLYYIHFPFPFADLDALADAMAEAVRAGRVRAVGVSNFSAEQMRRFAGRLGRTGVPLAANQVNYSLVNRKPESNGVLDACRELDVALVAYFPLASGRLAGATTAKDGQGEVLQGALTAAAQAHGAAISEVALNWLLARDARIIPIPGVTKARNAKANLKALDWTLTEAEFAAIDAASASFR